MAEDMIITLKPQKLTREILLDLDRFDFSGDLLAIDAFGKVTGFHQGVADDEIASRPASGQLLGSRSEVGDALHKRGK